MDIGTLIYIGIAIGLFVGLMLKIISNALFNESRSFVGRKIDKAIFLDSLSFPVLLISIIVLVFAVPINIFSYINTSSISEERNAIQRTLNNTRKFRNTAELVNTQDRMIEFNEQLARYKWANEHFDIFINDEVETTNPVE